MPTNAYKGAILYFLIFAWLLLLSAFLLYSKKVGFIPMGVLEYYSQKTFSTLLKINLPHIFVFGLISMVMLHFLVFTKHKHKIPFLAFVVFVSAFFELASPFAIASGIEFFSYIKIVSFAIFNFSLFIVTILLVYDLIFE